MQRIVTTGASGVALVTLPSSCGCRDGWRIDHTGPCDLGDVGDVGVGKRLVAGADPDRQDPPRPRNREERRRAAALARRRPRPGWIITG